MFLSFKLIINCSHWKILTFFVSFCFVLFCFVLLISLFLFSCLEKLILNKIVLKYLCIYIQRICKFYSIIQYWFPLYSQTFHSLLFSKSIHIYFFVLITIGYASWIEKKIFLLFSLGNFELFHPYFFLHLHIAIFFYLSPVKTPKTGHRHLASFPRRSWHIPYLEHVALLQEFTRSTSHRLEPNTVKNITGFSRRLFYFDLLEIFNFFFFKSESENFNKMIEDRNTFQTQIQLDNYMPIGESY